MPVTFLWDIDPVDDDIDDIDDETPFCAMCEVDLTEDTHCISQSEGDLCPDCIPDACKEGDHVYFYANFGHRYCAGCGDPHPCN